MNWPTIHSTSIQEEIDSIKCNADLVIQSRDGASSLNQKQAEQASQLLLRRSRLVSLSDAIPSLKSLLVLRRYQLLKKTEKIQLDGIQIKHQEEIQSLVKQYTFNTHIDEMVSDCTDIRDTIQKNIHNCYGNIQQTIEVIQALKGEPFSLHIRSSELTSIPYPSSIQIEKDLTRESLIVNGIPLEGSQGLNQIRRTIQSIVNKESDSLVDRILQQICRTRIGEYCYAELVNLFPMQEGTLLLVVDNVETKPIEIQLMSKIFETHSDFAWGVCMNCSFHFSYSIININDVTNFKEEVGKIQMHCQTWTCFGMDEYEDHNVEDRGYIMISIE